ncbi:hypothetical protein D3C85_1017640 [compost metagenome]
MNLNTHAASVKKFNSIAGNYNFNGTLLECWQMLRRQMDLIEEEVVVELIPAVRSEDSLEMLDGVCDAYVTLIGLMQMLEGLNFKVDEALEAVCANNSQKFTTSYSYAALSKEALEDKEPEMQFHICDTTYEGEIYYTVKDQNGKIRKLKSHQRPDIEQFVNKEFL